MTVCDDSYCCAVAGFLSIPLHVPRKAAYDLDSWVTTIHSFDLAQFANSEKDLVVVFEITVERNGAVFTEQVQQLQL